MINIIPVRVSEAITKDDDLVDCLKSSLIKLEDKDVLVITSKVVALTQGLIYDLSDIKPSDEAISLASNYSMNPSLTQLIINNSDLIIGGLTSVLLTIVNGVLTANAGIDKSNAGLGKVIAWPLKPYDVARRVRRELMNYYSISNLGVLISDSHVMPMRQGVVGQAIGVAGIKPVDDLRGRTDLFGYQLTYSKRAVADQLVTAAHLVSGECDERVPFVVIRGYDGEFTDELVSDLSSYVSFNDCLFMNSVREYFL